MIKLIFNKEEKSKIVIKTFKNLLTQVAKILQFKETKFLELTLVNDLEIQEINKIYRKKNKPTDVISFAFGESMDFPNEAFLGEIYISIETASKQALERKHSLENELQFLFIHGVLHIFGYDHKTDKEEKIMNDLAYKILGRK